MSSTSMYELGDAFAKAEKLCKALPSMIVSECEFVGADQLRKLQDKLKATIETLTEFESMVGDWEQRAVDQYDDLWNRLIKRRDEIAKRIEDIPPLPEVRIPYNFTTILDIAERCQHYTPEQWNRVIELARAFGTGEVVR